MTYPKVASAQNRKTKSTMHGKFTKMIINALTLSFWLPRHMHQLFSVGFANRYLVVSSLSAPARDEEQTFCLYP